MIKLARDAFAAATRLRALATVSAIASVAAAWVGVAPAAAQTRTLDLFYVHTGERAQITFKRNGKFDPAALKRLNVFLRDWRRNEPTRMDPALFDLVWEVYQKSGARRPITVVSAYRSPTTNNMLRSRSRGVAKNSQHTYGRAMDFFIADVPTSKLRVIALKMQHGGVGYYPTANTPFVHLDVGSVRHWPRMSRSQLMALFPNGRTLYLPSDGKPLPGYEQAAADYLRYKSGRGGSSGGGGFSFASSGSPNAYQAMLGRDSIVRPPPGASKNLLAMLFGGGADEEEDSVDSGAGRGGGGGGGGDEDAGPAVATKPSKPAPAPVAVAVTARTDDSDGALPGVNAAPALPFGTKPSAPPKPAAAPALPAATVVAPEAPPAAPAPQTVEALVASLPDAPPKKPATAEDAAPTVVATVAIPLPAKAPARPAASTIVLASATPLAKPPELLARNILGNSPPPVLGYADAGMIQANVAGGAVDVLAETARRIMRGTAAAPTQPRPASRTTVASAEDVIDTPLDAAALGLSPPSLTAVADEDPFAEDMMAPDRSDPRLLATTTTVRSMTFATLAAPNARMMPALIAGVDLPGDDSLHAKAVPGPRTDRFWGSATDPIYTASLP